MELLCSAGGGQLLAPVSEDGTRRSRPARTATKDGALMQKVDKGRLPQSARGCDNKNTKWLTQRSFLSSEAGSPRSRLPQIRSLVRACFLVRRGLFLALSSPGGKGKRALWALFIGARIPFTGAPLS